MVYECFKTFKRGMRKTTRVTCIIQNQNAARVGYTKGKKNKDSVYKKSWKFGCVYVGHV